MRCGIKARFEMKIKKQGCWTWTASLDSKGYGRFNLCPGGGKSKGIAAHRFAYQLWIGQIPEGYDLDHLCRNRACVNPEHLEPVTRRENLLRGIGPTAINSKKTECKNGHPFSGSNLILYKYKDHKNRICRICWNKTRNARRKKLRDKGLAYA